MKQSITPASMRIVVGLLVLLSIFAGCNRTQQAQQDVTKIAAILNLTGPSARFDAIKEKTLKVAEERACALYPDCKLQLRVFDAGGGPESTLAAVRQAKDWGASYFLSGTAPTALAIASQIRGAAPSTVQIANAATPDFGPPRQGEYRFWPDWVQEAELVHGILQDQKYRNVLLVHSADPYSQALTGELRKLAQSAVTFHDLQYDPASAPDFRPALLRAKQDQVQAIVVFGLPPGITALISQMAEAKWDQALIGGVNINLATKTYKEAGLKGPLWLVQTEAMLDDLTTGTEAQLYREQYLARHKEVPPFHALYLADALYFAAEANKNPQQSASAQPERVRAVREFRAASGTIKVSPDGTLRYNMTSHREN